MKNKTGTFTGTAMAICALALMAILFSACDLLDEKLSLDLQGTWEWCFNGQNVYNASSPTADASKGKMVITLDQITFTGDMPYYANVGYPRDIVFGIPYRFESRSTGMNAPGAQAIIYIQIDEDSEPKPYFNYIIRRRDDNAVILTVLKNPNSTGGGWGDSRDYPNYVKRK